MPTYCKQAGYTKGRACSLLEGASLRPAGGASSHIASSGMQLAPHELVPFLWHELVEGRGAHEVLPPL